VCQLFFAPFFSLVFDLPSVFSPSFFLHSTHHSPHTTPALGVGAFCCCGEFAAASKELSLKTATVQHNRRKDQRRPCLLKRQAPLLPKKPWLRSCKEPDRALKFTLDCYERLAKADSASAAVFLQNAQSELGAREGSVEILYSANWNLYSADEGRIVGSCSFDESKSEPGKIQLDDFWIDDCRSNMTSSKCDKHLKFLQFPSEHKFCGHWVDGILAIDMSTKNPIQARYLPQFSAEELMDADESGLPWYDDLV
jgi:hypothetical protein